ncbi:LL-diaminopimelate aminotransferase [Peribacillus sp. SCS-155]|uniref:LL-diaminopimelate aminotransferase n=1 Tax=Peribacillus sedimenti TaxID=3115297 RepID=UPI0039063EA2
MNFTFSRKISAFKPSIFNELAAYKQNRMKAGFSLIDLSIGSPDLPPPAFIRDCLSSESLKLDSYRYTMTGIQEFYEAVTGYYRNNHGISIDDKKEIAMLMGSQDGLVHLPMMLADEEDYILVPDPGYTAYETGVAMSGATPFFMPLKQENGYLPDLDAIPEEVAEKAKLMILNFPGNPIPAIAGESFFSHAIEFAKKYNIFILHDFAYSELYFDGHKPVSFLSIPEAKEVGIEMNSLSKSFNMAGCRIGYAAGNAEIIQVLQQFKSNLDYGVFLPIQKAAILAMEQGEEFCKESRTVYQRRRDLLIDGLASVGWSVEKPEAGMFIWAKIPSGWKSIDFTYALIDHANLVVTPGSAFGPSGEGYVRMAMVANEEQISDIIDNLKNSDIFSLHNAVQR